MLRTFSVLPVPSDLKGGSVYVFINVRWQLEIKPSTCISYILLPDLLNKFISALTTSDWSPCKKTIPGVSTNDFFFQPFNTADMARPGVDGFVKLEKKPGEKREKLDPPKSHGGLDGLQMIFSFWKKTGDSFGSDLSFSGSLPSFISWIRVPYLHFRWHRICQHHPKEPILQC